MSIPVGRRRWLGRALLALLSVVTEVGCDAEQVLDVFGADVRLRLEVAPGALTLEVGRTTFLETQLNGSRIQPSLLNWSSSDPGVATVDASGNVTCVGPGTATISAKLERDGPDDPVGSAQVTCVAPPLVQLVAEPITHTHTIGESPCPDLVGQFTLTNPGTESALVEIDRGSVAGLHSSVGGAVLGPGQSIVVELFFDCSLRVSFQSTVTITASGDDGRTQVETVEVDVIVQN